MPLVNCKVEVKIEQAKYCVLHAVDNGNTNVNPNNVIFTIKDTKLFFLL